MVGSGLRICHLRFWVQGLWLSLWGLGCKAFEFRHWRGSADIGTRGFLASAIQCRVLGFRVSGLRVGLVGLGLRV